MKSNFVLQSSLPWTRLAESLEDLMECQEMRIGAYVDQIVLELLSFELDEVEANLLHSFGEIRYPA